jgi:hypothetical protein
LPEETTGPKNEDNSDIDFRTDADLWSIYLEDAEREASEKSELWKAGLDSLLIFVSAYSLAKPKATSLAVRRPVYSEGLFRPLSSMLGKIFKLIPSRTFSPIFARPCETI